MEVFAAIVAVLCLRRFLAFLSGIDKEEVPVVGDDRRLLAPCSAVDGLKKWVIDGYRQYYHSVFKVRVIRDWIFLVSSPALIDELRKAPVDVLSFREGTAMIMQADYTLGDWRDQSLLHVGLIKSRLTRSLPDLFPAVIDEMDAAFRDEITGKLNESEWKAIVVAPHISRIVCRTSNRVFVGLPLCRNEEYVNLNVQYTMDVLKISMIMRSFPNFIKPVIGKFVTSISRDLVTAERLMTDLIRDRVRQGETYGLWEDKPNDFLQWILDTGEAKDKTIPSISTRILHLNFAATHTTAISFLFALYRIAAEPDKYQDPLRAEAHEALSRHGWSTAAMNELAKLDSVLREAQRFHGLGALSMVRKAMKDFTFSDGTTIKKGQTVAVASRGTHFDETLYEHANEFDGFRFYNAAEAGREELTNRLVFTDFNFLGFGTGRHACPGRFWAANEMKAMMAYMLVHYDFTTERPGEVPKEQWIASIVIPDRAARLLMRKREAPSYY